MAKKEKITTSKEEKIKPNKKKKTAHEKRKIVMQIVGWIMALIMVVGTLASIFAPLLLS